MSGDQVGTSARRSVAEQFVREVNAHTGGRLRLVGLPAHGTISDAAYVCWPDGRAGVLTKSTVSIETPDHDPDLAMTHISPA